MKKRILLLILASTVVGCATKPKVDTAPTSPTSVITSEVRNFGFKGLLATDGIEVSKTRATSQRIDQKYKFTGTVMKYVGGKQDMSQITRLNDQLTWQLDNKKKRYRECGLENCFTLSSYQDTMFEPEGFEEQAPVCEINFKSNDLAVKQTGRTRNINGFQVQEYKVSWVLVGEDSKGREDRNEISSTVWTTNSASKAAISLEEQYMQNYSNTVKGHALTDLRKAFPNEALSVLSKHLVSELPAHIISSLTKAASKGKSIQGYPISTKVEWNSKSDACPELREQEEAKNEKQIDTSSISGFLSSIGEKVVDKAVEQRKETEIRRMGMKPVFGYVREVKSIEMEQVKDHQMSIPKKYKLDNRS